MTRGDLFASNDSINDPLKTLFTLNHFDDKLFLDDLVILENVWLKLLVTTADLSNHIIRLLLEMNLVDTNQVEGFTDVHNWNRDAVLIDHSLKIHFEFDVFSRNEFDWRLLEQLLALLIDFGIGNASVFGMALNVVLILGRLINLLLLDSPNHFLFFNVEVLQLRAELHFLIVIELDQLLSLVFFELSSLLNHLVFLILYSIGSISLRS